MGYCKNQAAAIHNLEVQIGQISNLLTNRQQALLPSNTETNPKEDVKAITLRRSKILEQNQNSKIVEEDNKDIGNAEVERQKNFCQDEKKVWLDSQTFAIQRSRELL